MRPRFLITLLLMLVAGLASFLAVRYSRSPAVLAGERKAFFVKMYGKAGLVEDPTKFNGRHFFYAVRGDGSYARGDYTELPNGRMLIRNGGVTLVPEKKMIGFTQRTRSKTTFHLSEGQIIKPYARFTDPTCAAHPMDPRSFQVVGEDSILGFRVFHLRAATEGGEYWRAPDLDCYALRTRVEFLRPDGTIAKQTRFLSLWGSRRRSFSRSPETTSRRPLPNTIKGLGQTGLPGSSHQLPFHPSVKTCRR